MMYKGQRDAIVRTSITIGHDVIPFGVRCSYAYDPLEAKLRIDMTELSMLPGYEQKLPAVIELVHIFGPEYAEIIGRRIIEQEGL